MRTAYLSLLRVYAMYRACSVDDYMLMGYDKNVHTHTHTHTSTNKNNKSQGLTQDVPTLTGEARTGPGNTDIAAWGTLFVGEGADMPRSS
jgi:hypothetical protein